jgi:hypothetical protein
MFLCSEVNSLLNVACPNNVAYVNNEKTKMKTCFIVSFCVLKCFTSRLQLVCLLLGGGGGELVRWNVCRYKLLIFNYLQMFNRFPSAETKRGRPCGTIKFQIGVARAIQLLPSAPVCHKPMLVAGLFSLSYSFPKCQTKSQVKQKSCQTEKIIWSKCVFFLKRVVSKF